MNLQTIRRPKSHSPLSCVSRGFEIQVRMCAEEVSFLKMRATGNGRAHAQKANRLDPELSKCRVVRSHVRNPQHIKETLLTTTLAGSEAARDVQRMRDIEERRAAYLVMLDKGPPDNRTIPNKPSCLAAEAIKFADIMFGPREFVEP